MKQKLMPERITRTEEQQMQPDELGELKDKVKRQILIYLPGYLLIATGALMVLVDPAGSFKTVVNPSARVDDEETARMLKMAPYFSSFVLLMATIFFGKVFYQSIFPLLKDIQGKTKQLLFFKPAKNPMAFFNKYYLSTPLFQNQQIEVSREDFESISDHDELHIEMGPRSTYILRLCKGDKEIKYY